MRTRQLCLATPVCALLAMLAASSPEAVTEAKSHPDVPRASHWNRYSGPADVLQTRVLEHYAQLPLYFEPNLGQTDSQVQFLARAGGYTLFLTPGEAVMVLSRTVRAASESPRQDRPPDLQQAVVRMKLQGALRGAPAVGLERQPGISAYFLGNDPARWQPEVPHYRTVEYKSVYPGVDLVYHAGQRQIEYDFVVAPEADPRRIRLVYEGVVGLRVDGAGDLVLATSLGELRQHKPRAYQQFGTKQMEVAASYRIHGWSVGVDVAAYDRKRPLVIDPVLSYSTRLVQGGKGIAVDSAGAVYVVGTNFSVTFPTINAFQPDPKGSWDAFVTKLNPHQGVGPVTLAYSTYLGGSDSEGNCRIAVDSAGAAYVGGQTRSADFPTANAYQKNLGGSSDAFVTKFNPYPGVGALSLAYSTYLGGSEGQCLQGLAVDAVGAAYAAGFTTSTDFPTAHAFQASYSGGYDAFVTKLNAYGGIGTVTPAYSTYLGGSGADEAVGIAVDGTGAAYIVGTTRSGNFPTANAYQPELAGLVDVFVTKFSPYQRDRPITLVYSTHFGNGVDACCIAVDAVGAAYVAGSVSRFTDFPTAHAYQASHGGGLNDAFLVKFDPHGGSGKVTLAYSTYLGGRDDDVPTGVAVDPTGTAYVAGGTASSNFPTADAYQASHGGGLYDAFLVKFNPYVGNGTLTLAYSTFFGGSSDDDAGGVAVDGAGTAYVTGGTASPNFPTVNCAEKCAGGAFVAKFETQPTAATSPVITAVTNAWSGQPLIADAGWISIKGSNLAQSARLCRNDEIVGSKLPTSLDGVRVKINDRDAFLYYISPTQINVQVPSDSVAGPVPVQVTNSAGSSATFTVSKQTTAPGLFVWFEGTATVGNKYVGAVASEGQQVVYIGRPGLLAPAGIATRPAKPNETVLLFATGCGPTSPSVQAGQLVTPPAPPLADAVNVQIGGIPAVVAGNTGFLIFAGECQFNVTIPPNAPDGDLSVTLDVGGAKAQGNVFITVQK